MLGHDHRPEALLHRQPPNKSMVRGTTRVWHLTHLCLLSHVAAPEFPVGLDVRSGYPNDGGTVRN